MCHSIFIGIMTSPFPKIKWSLILLEKVTIIKNFLNIVTVRYRRQMVDKLNKLFFFLKYSTVTLHQDCQMVAFHHDRFTFYLI